MYKRQGNNRSRLGHGLSVAAALGHDDLGHDTDGDLGRRLGVKLQANRGRNARQPLGTQAVGQQLALRLLPAACLLYTSDAADERSRVDLGGRGILKKKNSRRRRWTSRGAY